MSHLWIAAVVRDVERDRDCLAALRLLVRDRGREVRLVVEIQRLSLVFTRRAQEVVLILLFDNLRVGQFRQHGSA
jgi:hypothetical protein